MLAGAKVSAEQMICPWLRFHPSVSKLLYNFPASSIKRCWLENTSGAVKSCIFGTFTGKVSSSNLMGWFIVGCMDEWVDANMNICLCTWIDGQMDDYMHSCMCGQMDVWMGGYTNLCMCAWMDEWMDRWITGLKAYLHV